jgi:pimeloyl-ACP methyl ester carboxylesterase
MLRRGLLLGAAGALAPGLAAQAAGALLKVPTRSGVSTTLFWEPVAGARATLLLFPGGGGGFGAVTDGRAGGNNFLVRSAPLFAARGFNVAIFGRPSDGGELDYADRIAAPHLQDIGQVLDELQRLSPAPVWLVGTSRGTVSATAAAIAMQARLAGLVLSSSVVSRAKPGAVPTQDLGALRLPVLLLHHRRDACPVCSPAEVPALLDRLTQAPRKQLIWVEGGAGASGDVCTPGHWHGYIGMEREAVDKLADWILQAPGATAR